MPVVSARNLVKAYGPQTLFSGVALTVRSGERVGLIGANGAGKSTLLRVMAGVEPPDAGVVDRRRDARVMFLAQEPLLDDAKTPREIVLAALSDWHDATTRHAEATRRIEAGEADDALLAEQARLGEAIERLGGWERGHDADLVLEKLGVRERDRPVAGMSGGERRRVALASVLVARPELAVLDEPTNHLDTAAIEWLEEHLVESFPGAVLLVTHDRYVLDAICDRIVELDGGALTEFTGGYSDYLDQKAELLAHAERVEQNRLNFLRRERAWLMRGAQARSTKQKARIQRAQAAIAIEAPKEASRLALRDLDAGRQRLGKSVLDLASVDVVLGGRTLIDDLTLHLVAGDRIGIVGPNGAGKTSLLRVVSGELLPARGTVTLGASSKIAYFDQARALLRDDWTVLDNVAEREGADRSGAGAVSLAGRTMEMRSYLELFFFDGAKQRQKVGSLSGGERARVALAKVLKSGANLLLLDEPTNDLDVATLGALEELLESWPGCALVVSHDRYFLDRAVNSILAFEEGGRVVRYAGGYQSYRSQAAASLSARGEEAEPAVRGSARPPAAEGQTIEQAQGGAPSKPLTYAERLELEGLLDLVSAAEAEVARVEASLADPSLYASRPAEVAGLRATLAGAQAEAARLTARWEALESRRS